METTLNTIKKLGNQIVKHYKSDLISDYKAIEEMKNGEAGVWTVRQCGTYLLTASRGSGIEFHKAVVDTFSTDSNRWFFFKKNEQFEEITGKTTEERRLRILSIVERLWKSRMRTFFHSLKNRSKVEEYFNELPSKTTGLFIINPETSEATILTRRISDATDFIHTLNERFDIVYAFSKDSSLFQLDEEKYIEQMYEELPW